MNDTTYLEKLEQQRDELVDEHFEQRPEVELRDFQVTTNRPFYGRRNVFDPSNKYLK